MRAIALLLAAALASCSPPAEQAPIADAPPPVEAPPPPQGPFEATSNTAMSITGDMSFTETEITFAKGIVLRTVQFATRSAYDPISMRPEETFDSVAPGEDTRVVDLRSVDAQEFDGARGGLCGDEAPTYVALVHEIPIRRIFLIAFSGAEAPGPAATNSAVCATFMYSAAE